MGGTLDETAFNIFEFEAEARINYYTMDRLKNDTVIPQAVKMLVFKLIALVQEIQESISLGKSSNSTTTPSITQQTHDGVSTSYNAMAASDVFTACKDSIATDINNYLQGVVNEAGRKLLYRGYYPGE
jgi:hypothetical protein